MQHGNPPGELLNTINRVLALLTKFYARENEPDLLRIVTHAVARTDEEPAAEGHVGGAGRFVVYLKLPESLFFETMRKKEELEDRLFADFRRVAPKAQGNLVTGIVFECGDECDDDPRPEIGPIGSTLLKLQRDPEELARTLPTVFSVLLANFNAERKSRIPHKTVMLEMFCHMTETAFRFISFLLLAELAESLDDDTRQKASGLIRVPSMGKWVDLACSLPRKDSRLMPDIGDILDGLGSLVPKDKPDAMNNVVELRNLLFHNPITSGNISELWENWMPSGMDRLLDAISRFAPLSIIAIDPERGARLLRGTEQAGMPYDGDVSEPGDPERESLLWLKTENSQIGLFPFFRYGMSDQDNSSPSPQMYSASDRHKVFYSVFGRGYSASSASGLDILNGIFPPRQNKSSQVFQDVLDAMAANCAELANGLIGREDEKKTVLAEVRASDSTESIFWLHGYAGVGKTQLLAAVAHELTTNPLPDELVLYYRFSGRDEFCDREKFLATMLWRLEEGVDSVGRPWRGLDGVEVKNESNAAKRLRRLLSGVKEPCSVLIVVDGLDEVEKSSPGFTRDVIVPAAGGRARFLCAGRSQGEELMRLYEKRGKRLFQDGLGKMSDGDIRALLFHLVPYPVINEILRADHDGKDGPGNRFVSLLLERSAGFPQYIVYAARDIIAGRIAVNDEERCRAYLPSGLTNYQEKLIEELSVSHDDQALRPLVNVLIALAREPLTAGMLRTILAEVGHWRSLSEAEVERQLQAIGQLLSMRRVGPDVAYEPSTYAMREQIVESPKRKHLVQQGRSLFATLNRDKTGRLEKYRLRHGVSHLLEMADSLWEQKDESEAKEYAEQAMREFCCFSTLMKRLDTFGQSLMDTMEIFTDSGALYGSFNKFGLVIDDDDTAWHNFLHIYKRVLLANSRPDLPANRVFLQLAVELAESNPLARDAESWLMEGNCNWFWLRNIVQEKDQNANALIRNINLGSDGHYVVGIHELKDGDLLCWASTGEIIQYGIKDGKIKKLHRHLLPAVDIVRLSGEDRFISLGGDGSLVELCPATGKSREMRGHKGSVLGISILPGNKLLSWASDGSIILRHMEGDEFCIIKEGSETFSLIEAMREKENNGKARLSEMGRRLFSSNKFNATSRLILFSYIPKLFCHKNSAKALTRRKYDDFRERGGFHAATNGGGIAFSPVAVLQEGRRILYLDNCIESRNGEIGFYDVATRELSQISKYKHGEDCGDRVTNSEMNIATKSCDANEQVIANTDNNLNPGIFEGCFVINENAALCWNQNGALWIIQASIPEIQQIGRFEDGIQTVKYFPNANKAAIFEINGKVTFWDHMTDSFTASSETVGWVKGTALHSDGDRFLTWGVSFLHYSTRLSIIFNPHNHKLKNVASDNNLILWNARTEGSIILKGHIGLVNGAFFCEEKNQIVSWGQDGTVRLWDEMGVLRGVFVQHNCPVIGVARSANGIEYISWDIFGRILYWNPEQITIPDSSPFYLCHYPIPQTQRIISRTSTGALHIWGIDDSESRWLNTGRAIISELSILPVSHTRSEIQALASDEMDRVILWNLSKNQHYILGYHKRVRTHTTFSNVNFVGTFSSNKLKLWDITHPSTRKNGNCEIQSIAIEYDDISSQNDLKKCILLHDPETLRFGLVSLPNCRCSHFACNGRYAFFANDNNSVIFVNKELEAKQYPLHGGIHIEDDCQWLFRFPPNSKYIEVFPGERCIAYQSHEDTQAVLIQNIKTSRIWKLTYPNEVERIKILGDSILYSTTTQMAYFTDMANSLEWQMHAPATFQCIIATKHKNALIVVDFQLYLFSADGIFEKYDRRNRSHKLKLSHLLHNAVFYIQCAYYCMQPINGLCFLNQGATCCSTGYFNNRQFLLHYQVGNDRLTFSELAARLAVGDLPGAMPFRPVSLQEKYGVSMDGFFQ